MTYIQYTTLFIFDTVWKMLNAESIVRCNNEPLAISDSHASAWYRKVKVTYTTLLTTTSCSIFTVTPILLLHFSLFNLLFHWSRLPRYFYPGLDGTGPDTSDNLTCRQRISCWLHDIERNVTYCLEYVFSKRLCKIDFWQVSSVFWQVSSVKPPPLHHNPSTEISRKVVCKGFCVTPFHLSYGM